MCVAGEDRRTPAGRVADWYAGRGVLVTGATGFLGKAIVEKLLRSCPDVGTVYLLVRHKRGLDPRKRADAYASSVVFSQLRAQRPDFARHLSVVAGDLSAPDFQLAEEDLAALRRDVSVVFHCAASVRFDDSLRVAVVTNVVGTKRALQLAEQLPHLQVFLHISTSFCHCDNSILEEKLYPARADPEKIIDIVSWMDDDQLAAITPKLVGDLPNTYALSKNLAEQLVANYAQKLPIVIARPSIVISSWKEPMPGWADNTNGPVGLLIAAGKGVLRTVLGHPGIYADVVPVDCTANAIIALAWHLGENRPKSPYVCNITNGRDNPVTWGGVLEILRSIILKEIPLEGGIWYPVGDMTSSPFLHKLRHIFFHMIPAYIIDFFVFLAGKKPFLVNVQNRLQVGQGMLSYYMVHEWLFYNDRLHALADSMVPEDRETFYTDIKPIDWFDFCRKAITGAKLYILKEDIENLPNAQRHMRKLYWLHHIVLAIFYGLLIWSLYTWSEPILATLEFVMGHIVTLFNNVPVVRVLADDISVSPDDLIYDTSHMVQD
ncbi:fatty acyl-CoA reductase 1-like isoform X2 [Schistocerca piceifrons]|nr:fatty acyl-CoA reductase 1-like isoform X2 [Schistocerca piceifrons]XP_047097963.1 fatty acyl-CoA reductase 1-like isoform X2 [Schistocerca piceifrons]